MSKINWTTLIKLAVASLIVGTILGLVGADPFDFWEDAWAWVVGGFRTVFGAGWEGLKTAARYMFFGAGVVVPIWLVATLWNRRPRRKPDTKTEA
ncbi:MAG: DUF6460 domain-containing protein [Parvularcula sp.]